MRIEELIQRTERFPTRGKYAGPERRKYSTLVYPPAKRPILKYGNYELEIIDISEKGMRIFNYNKHEINQSIQGTITFSSGLSIDVKGKIVWQYKNELGLFSTTIPRSIIEKEMYSLLRERG